MSEASSAMLLLGMSILIATGLLVGPVWLAARALGARRRSLTACFFAALLAALAFQVTTTLLPSLGGTLLGVAAMALVYTLLLRMSLASGLGVAVVASLLQWLIVMSALGVLIAPDAAGPGAPPRVIEM